MTDEKSTGHLAHRNPGWESKIQDRGVSWAGPAH
jgi:hypothetical protein